jgi:hypothetical protein
MSLIVEKIRKNDAFDSQESARDEIAVCGQVFSEPGIVQTVAAGPVREHEKRTLQRIGHDRSIHVQMQVGEEGVCPSVTSISLRSMLGSPKVLTRLT